MTILDRIAAYKREEVEALRARHGEGDLVAEALGASPVRGFRASLMAARAAGRYGLIAEIKKASPSKGLIREDFDPEAHARDYETGGASCLSVLTDGPSFQGSVEALQSARGAGKLPVLRKDFMIDPLQIREARAMGADCILIIMAMVDDETARLLLAEARRWKMDALIEIHNESELERALELDADMIGINNRDLHTFHTDLAVTKRLAPQLPDDILVIAESGLSTPDDLKVLADSGVTTFLIGESLMRQRDVAAATKTLLGL
ncbi:MAG: indole-3-glycerol phosphate synthase TrpC [Alphaproteobacteria bacterium]|nr:indole-3-glycerol phosphate synthase TrpC [Alphaproteobacteria bacterium]